MMSEGEGELASEAGRRCSFAAVGEENTSGKGNRGKRRTKGAVTGKESTCVTAGEREIGTSKEEEGCLNCSQKSVQAATGAAAGKGSCVSVILTAGSGSVTSGTTAGASGYFCRHWKTLPLPTPESGRRCHLRWLTGCRRTGSRDRRCSVQPFLLCVDMVIAKVAGS
ncbi:uncharacterized protein LOC110271520 [Arachis ipaensis]|uniref:uncharacterized protein LOC110271520 n=1 Tax=Arachis ipaensis TaxID=130454 RepID=UPI000A2B4942|nr:uncharacterized protein LOC110271520 [Arachis ipaensis]